MIGLGRVPAVSVIVLGEGAIKSKDTVKIFDQKRGVSYSFNLVLQDSYLFATVYRLGFAMTTSTLIDNLAPEPDVNINDVYRTQRRKWPRS